MNGLERQLIQKKLDMNQKIIKEEHRKPKDQRNIARINKAKTNTSVLNRWLRER